MRNEMAYFGEFSVYSNHDSIGNILLANENTKIELIAKPEITPFENRKVIYANLERLKKATCVDCIIIKTLTTNNANGEKSNSITLFPHHVIIGDIHLDPDAELINSFSFYTQDTKDIFRDSKDFGRLQPSNEIIKSITNEFGEKVKLHELSNLFFHSGRLNILECKAPNGQFRVYNSTTIHGLGINGDFLKNKVKIEFIFDSPVKFDNCLKSLLSHLRFLNILTGREQLVGDFDIHLKTENSPIDKSLRVYSSYQKQVENDASGDFTFNSFPINPTIDTMKFIEVYQAWMSKEPEFLISRIRYNDSFIKQHSYDVNRLVSAANTFDTLPKNFKPTKKNLNEEVRIAKLKSKEIFKSLPDSVERSIMLGALGRLESPTLTDIILYRSNIILEKCNNLFPELDLVIKVAVKVRNYFVHGTVSYTPQKIESSLPFLTDILEFIFVASDLIECGWDIESWSKEHYSLGHTFNNLRHNYKNELNTLKKAIT